MLDNQTINILETAAFDDNTVRLTCGQLERKQYVAVNEVLERIGGKWTRKIGAHVFPTDPAPLLGHILATGELPPKNPLAFFATPADVVTDMIWHARLESTHRVLEPSAGTGAIADAVRSAVPSALLHCVEIDQGRADQLRTKGHDVIGGDFLTFATNVQYDRILMNPPFTLAGDALAYITHIEKAYTHLAPDGRLVAIAPPGFTFRDDKRSRAFHAFVEKNGSWKALESGTFSASGTGVNTVMLWLDR